MQREGGGGIEVGHPLNVAPPRQPGARGHPVSNPCARRARTASEGGAERGLGGWGNRRAGLGTLPARPQIASSRVCTA
ncbi:hypothetical protein SXIM_10880 [Streptomyces xiamenensis]|uniref:Uncharacterized protein n=1 Tax=Streptomyces xiamenensis TaxID=408015 RepID=A0A0F7FSC2_9ACTN|nr:hypothetical protein SXIM_10880 [Streptomyces xiamenensis]